MWVPGVPKRMIKWMIKSESLNSFRKCLDEYMVQWAIDKVLSDGINIEVCPLVCMDELGWMACLHAEKFYKSMILLKERQQLEVIKTDLSSPAPNLYVSINRCCFTCWTFSSSAVFYLSVLNHRKEKDELTVNISRAGAEITRLDLKGDGVCIAFMVHALLDECFNTSWHC